MHSNIFDEYGKYYDLLYKDKDYKAETEYIINLINKYSINEKNTNKSKDGDRPKISILELGCGTGKHAHELNIRGFDVFGIDFSESMLVKAKQLGIKCDLGDVRTYRVERKFDTVISLFHILSYQIKDEDINQFFQTAYGHLPEKGLLIFDTWYKPAVLFQKPEKRIKELENDEIIVKRYCSPDINLENSIVAVNYIIEITNKETKEKKTIEETHLMRYFSQEEIKTFARNNGFKILRAEEWLSSKEPSDNTWGVCFVAVRI